MCKFGVNASCPVGRSSKVEECNYSTCPAQAVMVMGQA